jgi:hypothetical protein
LIHPKGGGTGLDPYLTVTTLTPEVLKDTEVMAGTQRVLLLQFAKRSNNILRMQQLLYASNSNKKRTRQNLATVNAL